MIKFSSPRPFVPGTLDDEPEELVRVRAPGAIHLGQQSNAPDVAAGRLDPADVRFWAQEESCAPGQCVLVPAQGLGARAEMKAAKAAKGKASS